MRDADVVVVGAGAGGLTAAAYLAAAGREVVVVDQQSQPGGCGTVFTHDGCEFDVGLHYLGGWGSHRPGVRAVLDPLGIEVDFREQDRDGFDTLLFDDMTFRVPAGLEPFRARLHEAFPAERRAIDRYLGVIASIAGGMHAAGPATDGGLAGALRLAWGVRGALRHSRATLGDLFERLALSPRLRSVLAWAHGTYGVEPARASLVLHAVITMHYLAGAWYPEGGGQVIADRLAQVVRDNGGVLILDAEAERIETSDGHVRAVDVVCADGRPLSIRAPAVVSAIDIKRTFLGLLEETSLSSRVLDRVRGYEMAMPLHVLYLVLDRDLRAEGVPNTNFAVAGTDDIDGYYRDCRQGRMPAGTLAWLTSASLKDPGNERLCPPGHTNLQVMSIVPADLRFWDARADLTTGEGYGPRKREMRDMLLAAAERAIPGIGGAVVHEEAATPLTLERYVGAAGGTAYGIAGTPGQFLARRPGPVTPVRGLFLAGASTRTGHGITGAMFGGVQAAQAAAAEPVRRMLAARVRAPGRGETLAGEGVR